MARLPPLGVCRVHKLGGAWWSRLLRGRRLAGLLCCCCSRLLPLLRTVGGRAGRCLQLLWPGVAAALLLLLQLVTRQALAAALSRAGPLRLKPIISIPSMQWRLLSMLPLIPLLLLRSAAPAAPTPARLPAATAAGVARWARLPTLLLRLMLRLNVGSLASWHKCGCRRTQKLLLLPGESAGAATACRRSSAAAAASGVKPAVAAAFIVLQLLSTASAPGLGRLLLLAALCL